MQATHSQAIKMVLDVLNDGQRIDRWLCKTTGGEYFMTDADPSLNHEDGVYLPCVTDGDPTEEDAQTFLDELV